MFGFGWNVEPPKDKDEEMKKGWGYLLGAAAIIGLPILHEKLSWFMEGKPGWLSSVFAQNEQPRQNQAVPSVVEQITPVDWSTLIGTGSVTAALIGGLAYGYKRWMDRKAEEMIQYIRIFPSRDHKFDGKLIQQFVNSLHQSKRPQYQRFYKGNEWFQLYFICKPHKDYPEGIIETYFAFPKDRQGYIKEKFRQTFRGFDFCEVKWYEVPILVSRKGEGIGGVIKQENPDYRGFPMQSFEGEVMSKILSHLQPNSAVAFSFHPTMKKRMSDETKATKKALFRDWGIDPKRDRETQLPEELRWQLKELSERQRTCFRPFDVKISMWQTQDAYGDVVYSLLNELNTHLAQDNQALVLDTKKRNPIDIVPRSYFPHWSWVKKIPFVTLNHSFLMSENEIANLLHFPDGMKQEEEEYHIYQRMESISRLEAGVKRSEFTSGIYIGQSLNPAQNFREMFLYEEVLRKMAVLVGRTGSGKTALIYGMVRRLIEKRLQRKTGGFTIIDPKKDFAYSVLTFLNRLKVQGLLTENMEDLFQFYDVTSDEYTFGLNPMQKPKNRELTEKEKHEMAKSVIGVLKSAFPGESILAEKFGELAVKCLLEDPLMNHTILGIADFIDKESPLRDRLYLYLKNGNPYQQRLAKNIERLSKDFGGTDIKPLLNRLHRLQENPMTRKIFGLYETTIKPLEIMEKGKIVCFNTEGLDAAEIRLVVGYILTEYHKAANRRTNTAETHFCIIDEAHEIQPPILWEKILPKDRAFGLAMILMTQYLEQFEEELLLSVTENTATIMSAAAGKKSAKVVEDITTGRVKKEDLQNLKSLTALIDTEDSRGKKVSFLVKAEPPYIYGADGEPTYYGENKQRTDREKNEAFEHAWETLGSKWMERDGRRIEEVEKELEKYEAALRPKREKEKEEREENVVDLNQKKSEKEQKQQKKSMFDQLELIAATKEELE